MSTKCTIFVVCWMQYFCLTTCGAQNLILSMDLTDQKHACRCKRQDYPFKASVVSNKWMWLESCQLCWLPQKRAFVRDEQLYREHALVYPQLQVFFTENMPLFTPSYKFFYMEHALVYPQLQFFFTGNMPFFTPIYKFFYRDHALIYPQLQVFLQGTCPSLTPRYTFFYREHALAYRQRQVLQGACPCLPPTTSFTESMPLLTPITSFLQGACPCLPPTTSFTGSMLLLTPNHNFDREHAIAYLQPQLWQGACHCLPPTTTLTGSMPLITPNHKFQDMWLSRGLYLYHNIYGMWSKNYCWMAGILYRYTIQVYHTSIPYRYTLQVYYVGILHPVVFQEKGDVW